MEWINPIFELLSAATGGRLKTTEIRLVDGMDGKEVAIFAKLMRNVVSGTEPVKKAPFGYGHFDD